MWNHVNILQHASTWVLRMKRSGNNFQSPDHPSEKKFSPPVDAKCERVPMAKVPYDCNSETTGTAVGKTKFDVAQYQHKERLLKVIQKGNPETLLRDRRDNQIPSFANFFCAHGINHAWELLCVTNTSRPKRSRACGGHHSPFWWSGLLGSTRCLESILRTT